MQIHSLIDPYSLRQDGSKLLTANWDAGSFKITAQQLESDIATGTAPLVIASTTVVANLNADLWDGYQFADYLNQAVKSSSSPTFTAVNATNLYIDTNLIKTNSVLNTVGINVTAPGYSLDVYGNGMRAVGQDGQVGGDGDPGEDGYGHFLTGGAGGTGGYGYGTELDPIDGGDGGPGGSICLTPGSGGAGGGSDWGAEGAAGADGKVIISTSIELTAPTESDIHIGGFGTSQMYIEGDGAAIALIISTFTADGDATDSNFMQFYARGTRASLVNTELLAVGYASTLSAMFIQSRNAGTGTLRPLILYTGTNTNQLYLNTNGRVGINTAAPATALDVVGAARFGDSATNYANFAADGELTLAGTARVTNGLWIGANGVKAPPTKPAAFVDHGVSGAWEFSDATDDTIVANMRIPNRMDRTVAPTISLGWSSTTLAAFCEWQIEYLWRATNEDTTAAADDTLLSSTDADASTSSGTAEGFVITTFTLAAPSATDVCLHLRIKRRADLAADTINGDTVELHGICMNFTSNKLGTAT